MRTANFSIVILTESKFTKQSAFSTGRWLKCFKNMIEHTHFKKKNEKIFFKVGILYHIFEAFHPSPSTKGTLFSKIAFRKNHNGKIGCPHILD